MISIETTSGSGSFRLLRGDAPVLTLKKPYFPFGQSTSFYNRQNLVIRKNGLFGRGYTIFKQGEKWGELTAKRNGRTTFTLIRADGTGEDVFTLKPRGLFKPSFELQHEGTGLVLKLQSRYHWLKSRYSFDVSEYAHEFSDIAINELLIYCGFGANIHLAERWNS